MMLNRNDIIERLIKVRRDIYKKELLLDRAPSKEDIKIKRDLDNLILDVIGDFLNKSDKEQIDKILLKVICNEISVDMAMVAIREIALSYFSNNNIADNSSKKINEDRIAVSYYEKGYR